MLILILGFLSVTTNAQNCASERYLSNVFQSSVSQDVVYGNSPALTAVYVAENVTVNQDMTMDIFFPVGDDLPKRPAVMLAYGGGYLFGTKEDEDVWTTCDSLAKKGYVTASINYRMNLNVASTASAVRAIYRAAQDYSAALRFLKEYADTYRIDTNYIFVGGVSAGGFSAMHAVFLDENERPESTFQSGIGGINPDLGCVSCAGNNYAHSNNVRGIVNLWGALMDTAYIQQDELIPMTLFHGTSDLIVPNDHGFPFTALFLMPEVFGSTNIATRVNNLGGNAELNLFNGVGHNIWGLNVNNVMVDGPTEHWSPITDSIISFLYQNIRPEAPLTIVPANVCQYDTVLLMVQSLPSGGRACWEVEDAIILSASPDSSQLMVVWENVGSYDVNVTVFNHLDAASVPVTSQIQVDERPVVIITDFGNQLEASGSYPYYQWYLDGTPLQGENQSILVPIALGAYTVEAVNQFGCTSISEELVVVGIEEGLGYDRRSVSISAFDVYGRFLGNYGLEMWNHTRFTDSGVLLLEYYDENGAVIHREKKVRIE
ncbi:MAG: alpha/beta hydrolase [Flavobacteriales bacterium]|jgi:acetyl esterase/lipase|nr:alpha/beta hydrolase [Flavobacteriales bacterium]